MPTERDYQNLEEDERNHTNKVLALMVLVLNSTRKDIKNVLREFYHKYGRDGIVSWQDARKWISHSDHRKRLTALMMEIAEKFQDDYDKLYDYFQELVEGIVDKETAFFGVVLPFDDLDFRWGVDNKNWKARLDDDFNTWIYNIQKDISRAVATRDNLDNVLDAVDERFSTIERVLRNLGMTESTAVGSIARKEIFKTIGVKKYKFYAREDERTCEECGALHGKVFPMTAYQIGVTASPIHPRCRCYEVMLK